MDESEVRKFENEIKPLKMSEAMRLGAKLRPKCTGVFFENGKSCAIGAIYEGRTGKTCGGVDGTAVSLIVPELFVDEFHFSALGNEVYGRNDWGKESRESIADWLESKGY